MPTTINGTTGVSQVQDNTITSAKIVNGTVAQGDLDTTNKLAQCKAWVNFDGTLTGTITPRAGFNISSIVKNGTGDYTITFTTSLADANYAISGFARGAVFITPVVPMGGANFSQLAGSLRFQLYGTGGTLTDASTVTLLIFGN